MKAIDRRLKTLEGTQSEKPIIILTLGREPDELYHAVDGKTYTAEELQELEKDYLVIVLHYVP